jgi:hypothetical protein
MTKQPSEHSNGRGRAGHWRWIACALAASLLAGCGSVSGVFSGAADTGSSIGSRFSQIFGGNSQAVGEPSSPAQTTNGLLSCPPVSIRFGASTLAVGLPGKPASGQDLRYQATITRTARDCALNGSEIAVRLGIEGRIIVGPAGAPPAVEIPLRMAVVQETVQQTKVVFTKFYTTSVAMPADGGNASFSFVAEDIGYPLPSSAANDSYVFYIGFDPGGLKPEPAPRPARRAKPKS